VRDHFPVRVAAPDLKFAAAVAEFGMILRDLEYKVRVVRRSRGVGQEGKGADENGYRASFLELVRKAPALKARM